MHLPFYFAKRYLFARKSHNVINIISGISAAGMAIGTAALIIILSVYNGFDEIVKSMLGNIEPDVLITPAAGKVFVPEGPAWEQVCEQEGIETICTVLSEQVFIGYDGRQGVAIAKGVDELYEVTSPLQDYIRRGHWALHRGDVPLAIVGSGLAHTMGINPAFVAAVELYFPSRTSTISLANPLASLESVKAYPSGVFSINNDVDNQTLIVPIGLMRELLEYENEVSGVEIRTTGLSQKEISQLVSRLESILGDEFKVADRFHQNEALYKMMRYEKISIYLILIFVIIIIAFNIFGSLTMLIIEKTDDIATLHSLGAEPRTVRQIFILEGWLISLLGLAVGLIIGVGFAILQQQFGWIKMPGNFVVSAYPVVLQVSDIVLTALGTAVIGYLIALFPSRRLK